MPREGTGTVDIVVVEDAMVEPIEEGLI